MCPLCRNTSTHRQTHNLKTKPAMLQQLVIISPLLLFTGTCRHNGRISSLVLTKVLLLSCALKKLSLHRVASSLTFKDRDRQSTLPVCLCVNGEQSAADVQMFLSSRCSIKCPQGILPLAESSLWSLFIILSYSSQRAQSSSQHDGLS